MKTVRLSEQLKRDIRRKAEEKFEKVNPKQTYPEDGAVLLTRYNLQDKISKTTKSFEEIWPNMKIDMRGVERLRIKSSLMVDKNDVWDSEKEDYVTKKVEDEFEYTLHVPVTKFPEFLVDYREFTLAVPSDDETFLACYQVEVHNKDLERKKRAFTSNIRDVLNKFHTLNQLLKADPSLKDLVPSDRLQKMYEKDERGERAKEQQELADTELQDLREVLLEDKLLGDD